MLSYGDKSAHSRVTPGTRVEHVRAMLFSLFCWQHGERRSVRVMISSSNRSEHWGLASGLHS